MGTIVYRWTTPLLHGNHCLQMDDTVITWEPLSTDGRHRYYMGTIVYRWTTPLLHGNHCLQMDDTVITWEPLSTEGRHRYYNSKTCMVVLKLCRCQTEMRLLTATGQIGELVRDETFNLL
jgi:hypothetical protein